MSLVISKVFTYDTDAGDYIQRVEGASGDNAALEPATRQAINNFVIGCKQDGIWNAIKASCILSGARTLNGALQPLVGTAPTNAGGNFVSGDYNRKTGLVGDGSTKYLNSNRNNNADPQNSRSLSLYLSTVDSLSSARQYIGTQDVSGASVIGRSGTTTNLYGSLSNASDLPFTGRASHSGFVGIVRNSSSAITMRSSSTQSTNTVTSESPRNESIFVYARPGITNYTNARLAFYSIGESLDLALLDARVTALITAFGVAIP